MKGRAMWLNLASLYEKRAGACLLRPFSPDNLGAIENGDSLVPDRATDKHRDQHAARKDLALHLELPDESLQSLREG